MALFAQLMSTFLNLWAGTRAADHIIEYIEGVSALDQLPLGHADLLRIGRMIRQIHDASETVTIPNADGWNLLLPTENPDLMCHNDHAPWNLIMGERWVFIDWDAAGPSTRLWDLAYAVQSFGMLIEGQPVDQAALRLRAFVDGYGADAALRTALPAAMANEQRPCTTYFGRHTRLDSNLGLTCISITTGGTGVLPLNTYSKTKSSGNKPSHSNQGQGPASL